MGIHITLKTPVYQIGKPRPNAFPGILSVSSISKRMTLGDLKNEIATPNSRSVAGISLKLLMCKIGKPRLYSFPGILSTISIIRQ